MSERPPIRVALDEAAFRELVAGRVATVAGRSPLLGEQPVAIILSDIGWDRMCKALDDAFREQRE